VTDEAARWILSYGYREPDKTIVKDVYSELTRRGHDVFYGPDAHAGDKSFSSQWMRELVTREACACIVSPEYLTEFCLEECAAAKNITGVTRFVVLLCTKEEITAPLKQMVAEGTNNNAAALYTDVINETIQFVVINEKDPKRIADKLEEASRSPLKGDLQAEKERKDVAVKGMKTNHLMPPTPTRILSCAPPHLPLPSPLSLPPPIPPSSRSPSLFCA
jgi:hypothetical protein